MRVKQTMIFFSSIHGSLARNEGKVESPLSLTFEDVERLPAITWPNHGVWAEPRLE